MTLLAEAPAGRHLAQFHREPAKLSDAVYAFLEAGLRRDQSVLIIAGADQKNDILERLEYGKFHVRALGNSGQLGVMDAEQVLEQFTPNGVPDWARFRGALVPMLLQLQPFGRGMRIYSQMAGVLWQHGKYEAAIRLEELWNALAISVQFSLYCCYSMDTHCEESYAGPLEEVGRTHSDILGTSEDERFGVALDQASKEVFGISLTQMAGVAGQNSTHRFPSAQRAMLWIKRNLPMSTSQLAERARHYYQQPQPKQFRRP